MPSDPLGDLLRHWAERHSREGSQTAALRERVTAALRDTTFLDLPAVPAARDKPGPWSRLWWFAAGAAAAMLLVWGLPWTHRTPATTVAREERAETPPLVRLPQTQLIAKTRLLAAAEELFDGRLAWMAEDGRDVQLGLTDVATSSPNADPILVRMVVLVRKPGGKDWNPVWETDLVTRDEQLVELVPRESQRSRLRLWAYTLPDGRIAVDSDLALAGALPIHSASSGVQQGGVPREVFSLRNDDAEYRVYQTVAVLPKG
jgi:hypothetical protein